MPSVRVFVNYCIEYGVTFYCIFIIDYHWFICILVDITGPIYSYFQCGCYIITKSTFYNEGKYISVVTQRHGITYKWSTSTTQHSAHMINNIEIIIWSLRVAANNTFFFPQSYRASWYCQSLYLPTDTQESCFKRMLKFTLKQLLHVSVQSSSPGSVLFEVAKVIVVKIIC